jgi:hypothetical protein
MTRGALVFAGLLAVVALCWAVGSCGSFVSFDNWDGTCFGCEPTPDRTWALVFTPAAQNSAVVEYWAYDTGDGTAGHRIYRVIRLYDKDSATPTDVLTQGSGPKGNGYYLLRVVDIMTPHINTNGLLDVSGF